VAVISPQPAALASHHWFWRVLILLTLTGMLFVPYLAG